MFSRCHYSKFSPLTYLGEIKKNVIQMPKLISGYNDIIISRYVKQNIPSNYFDQINEDLSSFAFKMENEYFHLHEDCERHQPKLEKYDGWGKRVDKLHTCDAWKRLKIISSQEGLVAIPYEKNFKEYSRIYQGIKLILFSSLSGLYSCPLAMTDGAAFVLQALGNPLPGAYNKLVSRDPERFWTSGQWMTEKDGGSDVANAVHTVAVYDANNNCHRLYGYKWFSSATDANMSLTLARSVDENNELIPSGRGLSLYYVETVSSNDDSLNDWNHLELVTLKDKLGTRQLPTAEIILNGSKAVKLSEDGRGISSIAGMLTVTRIHNAIASVSAMRRIVLLATEYARHRVCFGSPLIDKPLHTSTLVRLDVESRAAFYFLMDVLRLLGLQEAGEASLDDMVMLRVLGPLLKLYTAKQAMEVVSEAMECFGGQGYIESTGIPGMLRDAQVLPIWEGTTNVLSIDMLRALKIGTHQSAIMKIFMKTCAEKIDNCQQTNFHEEVGLLRKAMQTVEVFIENNKFNADLELYSRNLAFAMSRIYMGVLLLEQACSSQSLMSDHLSLTLWTNKDLVFQLNVVDKMGVKPNDWIQFFR